MAHLLEAQRRLKSLAVNLMPYFSTDPGELGEFGCGADCSCKSCRSASNVGEVYEKEEIAPPAPAKPPAAPKMGGWFSEQFGESLRRHRIRNNYLYAKEPLGQIRTSLQPRNLTGPPPQCEAIPEKYKLRGKNRLTSGRVNCPTRADAVRILRTTIARAVEMLDNTIGELVRAREAACRGEPLGWPALGDVTACWLKYRLGVCIDDLSAWIKGAFRKSETEPTPVAEVIRRLVVPRNLLATNQIAYVCDCAPCNAGDNACVIVCHAGECIRTPDRVIRLCPPFWSDTHAPFREQTIIHEAVHLTHCAPHGTCAPPSTTERATGIGWPECLAQFVVATSGKRLDPAQRRRCGFTKRCGPVSEGCRQETSRGGARSRRTLPDWKP
ncbi:MAG: hypothetical protein WBW78_07840 [Terrimicrobiaceae bacterium]